MKTKTKKPHPECVVTQMSKQKVTSTTLSQLGVNLGKMMDLMHDPQVGDVQFSQIYSRTKNSLMLSASNDEMFISFTIEKKGGLI